MRTRANDEKIRALIFARICHSHQKNIRTTFANTNYILINAAQRSGSSRPHKHISLSRLLEIVQRLGMDVTAPPKKSRPEKSYEDNGIVCCQSDLGHDIEALLLIRAFNNIRDQSRRSEVLDLARSLAND
jgi:hypothetical protein